MRVPRALGPSIVEGSPSQAKPARIVNQAGVRAEILFLRLLSFRNQDRNNRAAYAIQIAEVRWREPSCILVQRHPSGRAGTAYRQEIDARTTSQDRDERLDRPGARP